MTADLVVVGAHGDERTLGVEQLFEDDDLALHFIAGQVDDVHPFVQDELLPGSQRLRLERRTQADLQLASLREDVHGAVLVGRQVDPVRGWRRGQLLDLRRQRLDALARLTERLDKLLPRRVRRGRVLDGHARFGGIVEHRGLPVAPHRCLSSGRAIWSVRTDRVARWRLGSATTTPPRKTERKSRDSRRASPRTRSGLNLFRQSSTTPCRSAAGGGPNARSVASRMLFKFSAGLREASDRTVKRACGGDDADA